MRTQKPETVIRNLRRELKEQIEDRRRLASERDTFRARATKAEQEVAEWKRRFDALLARTPDAKAPEA